MNPLDIIHILQRIMSTDLHPTMLDPFEVDEVNEWLAEQEEKFS